MRKCFKPFKRILRRVHKSKILTFLLLILVLFLFFFVFLFFVFYFFFCCFLFVFFLTFFFSFLFFLLFFLLTSLFSPPSLSFLSLSLSTAVPFMASMNLAEKFSDWIVAISPNAKSGHISRLRNINLSKTNVCIFSYFVFIIYLFFWGCFFFFFSSFFIVFFICFFFHFCC